MKKLNMKKLIANLLVGIFSLGVCVNPSAEEYKQLYVRGDGGNGTAYSEEITLKAGQTARVKLAYAPYYVYDGRTYNSGNIIYKIDENNTVSFPLDESRKWFDMQFVGPAKLSVSNQRRWGGAALISIVSLEIKGSTASQSGQVLVLPESNESKFKVVMESSTDLINWTEDQPGTKDPSDKKRFYRLRAVKE